MTNRPEIRGKTLNRSFISRFIKNHNRVEYRPYGVAVAKNCQIGLQAVRMQIQQDLLLTKPDF